MADPLETRLERAASDPRRQWGWGPSELSSNEEKDAWKVVEGKQPRDIRNDPAYRDWAYNEGGYAKSRRTIRMQEDWQAQQKKQLELQGLQQAQRRAEQEYEYTQRDQMMQEDKFGFDRETSIAAQKLKAQQQSEAKQIISAMNDLDPRSEDFYNNMIKLKRDFPLGAIDPSVIAITDDFEKANSVYETSRKQSETDALREKQKQDDLLRVAAKVSKQAGGDLSDVVYSDVATGELVIDPVKLGEMEAKATEKPPKDLDVSIYRQEAKGIRDKIAEIDDDIIAAQEDVDATKDNKKLNEVAARKLAVLLGQRKARVISLEATNSLIAEAAQGGDQSSKKGEEKEETPQPQSFDTPEEADAANLPKGTIVVIDGRRARID